MRDDQDTPTISWPNYHSGANGDYQPVVVDEPVHELLRTTGTASGRIEWFPAHPHEGAVSACVPSPPCWRGPKHRERAPLQPRRGLDGEPTADGRAMGRALAESTFHHFADYNWDLDRGAPSFVTEHRAMRSRRDPSRLAVYKDYVHNIAYWLHPATSRGVPAEIPATGTA